MNKIKTIASLICCTAVMTVFADSSNYAEIDLRADACTTLIDEQSGNALTPVKDAKGQMVYKLVNQNMNWKFPGNGQEPPVPAYKCFEPKIIKDPDLGNMMLPITLFYGEANTCGTQKCNCTQIVIEASIGFRDGAYPLFQKLNASMISTNDWYQAPNTPFYGYSQEQFIRYHLIDWKSYFTCQPFGSQPYSFGGAIIDLRDSDI